MYVSSSRRSGTGRTLASDAVFPRVCSRVSGWMGRNPIAFGSPPPCSAAGHSSFWRLEARGKVGQETLKPLRSPFSASPTSLVLDGVLGRLLMHGCPPASGHAWARATALRFQSQSLPGGFLPAENGRTVFFFRAWLPAAGLSASIRLATCQSRLPSSPIPYSRTRPRALPGLEYLG